MSYIEAFEKKILEYCHVKQESFARGAAISLTATLACGKIKWQDVWPNFYAMNIGETCSGKDFPLSFCSNVLNHPRLVQHRLAGLTSYTSGAMLVKNFRKQRIRLDMLDEFSFFLKSIKDGGNENKNLAMQFILELITRSSGYFGGNVTKTGAGDETGACYNPCLNILATSQPRTLTSNLNDFLFDTGMVNRFFYFVEKKSPERNQERIFMTDISYDGIVNFIIDEMRWTPPPLHVIGLQEGAVNVSSDANTELRPANAIIERGLLEQINEVDQNIFESSQKAKLESDKILAARAPLILRKLILIRCFDQTPPSLAEVGKFEIVADHVEWALEEYRLRASGFRPLFAEAHEGADPKQEKEKFWNRFFRDKKALAAWEVNRLLRNKTTQRSSFLAEFVRSRMIVADGCGGYVNALESHSESEVNH